MKFSMSMSKEADDGHSAELVAVSHLSNKSCNSGNKGWLKHNTSLPLTIHISTFNSFIQFLLLISPNITSPFESYENTYLFEYQDIKFGISEKVCKTFCNFRKLILCRGLQITKTKKYQLKVFSLLIYVQDGRPPPASFPPSNFVQTFRSAFFRKNSFFSKFGNFSKFSDFFAKALIFGSFSKNNIILYAFYGESVAFSWFWKNQVFFQKNDQLTFKKTQIL